MYLDPQQWFLQSKLVLIPDLIVGEGGSFVGHVSVSLFCRYTGMSTQCCGAGAGGAEIIWDLEPEPKLNFNKHLLQSV